MTSHENYIKACLLLEQIQEEAGSLWSNCQYYMSDSVSRYMLNYLKNTLNKLRQFNRDMEN